MNDFFTRGLVSLLKSLFGVCLNQLSDLPTFSTNCQSPDWPPHTRNVAVTLRLSTSALP
jgi:hypothetical protein